MFRIAAFVSIFALAIASSSNGGPQKLTMRVSPTFAFSPAMITVRTTIEPDDDNRFLSVSLESEDYGTSSQIPLEGRNAARLNVLRLRGVPSGTYEVTAVVHDSRGPLASARQIVRIQPAPGR